MNKKEIILNKLKNTYCRIRPSKIAGVGVFAIKNIPKGINPFEGEQDSEWVQFEKNELKDLDKEIRKMIDDFYATEKNGSILIPDVALNGMDISFFMNDSEIPNVHRRKDGTFMTTRVIKNGEELTISYETFDENYKK